MSKIFVSGLMNVETSCRVDGFPIGYVPIQYNFFGVTSVASGVGLNVTLALTTLGDRVSIASFAADDPAGDIVRSALTAVNDPRVAPCPQTPQSVVLFDGGGKRRVYTDLKDIQERELPGEFYSDLADFDAFCLCNVNFSRRLLPAAEATGMPIFCDVHCISDICDEYNADFMRAADVLFLSNESIRGREESFIRSISSAYSCRVIVIGMGEVGAMLYTREDDSVSVIPAVHTREVVNTVGAGDALFSAFTHFYVKGCPAREALERASVFASYKIGESGATKGFLTEDEVLELLSAQG